MIVDDISKIERYERIYPLLGKAVPFMKKAWKESLEPGIYEIEGNQIYAVIQQYETQPADCLVWEYHEKYLDIQLVLDGEEEICWTPRKELIDQSAYDEENDCVTADGCHSCSRIIMKASQFAVFEPDDAHKPKCMYRGPGTVKKMVAKILI